MIEASGQGLVPVIVDDGEVVVDSTEILRHLERRYPDPPLFPADPARRAEMDVFLDWFNEVYKAAPNAIEALLEEGNPPEGEEVEVEAERMREHLDLFERLLAGRDYLMGEGPSAADFAAFPFLKYARGRDPDDDELFHRILELNQPLGDGHPRLTAWIERIDALPRA
ncbi:MAG: glutathione S-transferase family protein [Solirubrobacterales bacterium]